MSHIVPTDAPDWVQYEAEDGVACLTCGREMVHVKAHANGYDYCRDCHYTGNAAEAIRSAQIDEFREALPGWTVGVEHTGGGCFWLAFYPPESGGYMYAATDGEASLPDHEGPIRGGWGYVGRYFYDADDDEKTEAHPDYEGTMILDAADGGDYWEEYPKFSRSDAEIVEAIRADWEKVGA